jgi:putative membrane protein
MGLLWVCYGFVIKFIARVIIHKMKFLAKIVLAVVVNAAALVIAYLVVPGFQITPAFQAVAVLAVILTVLNFTIKPALSMILGPVIFLTLGLGYLFVNGAILYLLDFLSQNLTIQSIAALVYGTLIISAANFIFHSATK